MPELPEVETVKNTLSPLLIGRTITACRLNRGDIIKHPSSERFVSLLTGSRISSLSRRGKYLLIHLKNGDRLIIHLRMTGRLLCTPADKEQKIHTHVIFELDNGNQLRFSDTRRFGCLWLLKKDEQDTVTGMSKLGIEPFDDDFSGQYLADRLSKRHISIKQGLLDQSVIAGLGNIYVDESLFAAEISPLHLTCALDQQQWQKLAEVIPQVLKQSIANNGTTFSDYLDGEGNAGKNMPFLQAYGREGLPCRRCNTPLLRKKIAGRSSYFCPVCQK